MIIVFIVFFLKQKTAYEMRISDWSSDVCSSDLPPRAARPDQARSAFATRRCQAAGLRQGPGREDRQARPRRPVHGPWTATRPSCGKRHARTWLDRKSVV